MCGRLLNRYANEYHSTRPMSFKASLMAGRVDTFALAWRRPFPWFGNGRVQFVLDENARVTELRLDVPNDDFWFFEPEFKRAEPREASTALWRTNDPKCLLDARSRRRHSG